MFAAKSLRVLTVAVVFAAMAFQTMAPAYAAPVAGAKYDVHCVRARGSDTFDVTFRGGDVALVAISGDGDTDLDLFVYDENGFLVGCDTDGTDTCVVRFLPKWTGRFRIVVRNLGYVDNVYEIAAT